MMNSATCLLSWQQQIVHWLPYGMVKPRPETPFNVNPSNILGDTNRIKPFPLAQAIPVVNKKISGHYKHLSDFMNKNIIKFHLIRDNFEAKVYYDWNNNIECYYMVNTSKDFAFGWVHNLNAYWRNHYYFLNSLYRDENYYGCTSPSTDSIFISGFQNGYSYDMWYERSSNYSSILPGGYYTHFCTLGGLPIDFSGAPLGCKEDSLPEDYAFIIERVEPRSRGNSVQDFNKKDPNYSFDFNLYPNPNDGLLHLSFGIISEKHKEISIYDPTGRRIYFLLDTGSSSLQISMNQFSKGVYYVEVKIDDVKKVRRVVMQ